jgi:hypothetical protein
MTETYFDATHISAVDRRRIAKAHGLGVTTMRLAGGRRHLLVLPGQLTGNGAERAIEDAIKKAEA